MREQWNNNPCAHECISGNRFPWSNWRAHTFLTGITFYHISSIYLTTSLSSMNYIKMKMISFFRTCYYYYIMFYDLQRRQEQRNVELKLVFFVLCLFLLFNCSTTFLSFVRRMMLKRCWWYELKKLFRRRWWRLVCMYVLTKKGQMQRWVMHVSIN